MPVNRIPVLLYHHINHHDGDIGTVSPEVFAAHLDFLVNNGYHCLSVDELLVLLHEKRPFDRKSVVITFDDGWLDTYRYAVPQLEKLQCKATFFIVTARIDAASCAGTGTGEDTPDHETSKSLIQQGKADTVVLSWNLVNELAEKGIFSFHSHMVTHRRCADLDVREVHYELTESKLRIESQLGKSCNGLCWPYGSFTNESIAAARNLGYKGLFTTIDGYCETGSDPFLIRRIDVINSVDWLQERLSEGSQ